MLFLLNSELVIQLLNLGLEFVALCRKDVHVFRSSDSVLLHRRLNLVDLAHVLFDDSFLSGNLPVKLVDWEISTHMAHLPQSLDLLPNLRQVTLYFLLLVGLTLSLNSLDDIRHDHVEVKDALSDVVVLLSHKEEHVASLLAKRVCSEVECLDGWNELKAFQEELAGRITELVAGEVKVLQHKLVVLIASPYYLSDTIQLDEIATDVQRLKPGILQQTFTDGQGGLSAEITAAHAQVVERLTVGEERDQCLCEAVES